MSSTSRTPFATFAVVGLTVIAAYATAFWPDAVLAYGFAPEKPIWYTALTCLFLHQNLLHLLGNLVFLAAVGPAVEAAAGAWRFLAVYFVGGFVGVLAHWVFMRTTPGEPPLIGASGCVAACIGYYCVRYLGVHVMLAPKIGVPVLAVAFIWIGLQVAGALVNVNSWGHPAYWAHLGGFVAGVVLSLLFRAPLQADRQFGHAVISKMEGRGPAAALAAADLHLSEHPDDVQGLFRKVEAHSQMGDVDHEAEALLKLLDRLPERDQAPVLKRLVGIGQVSRLPSLRRIRFAETLSAGDPDLAKDLLLSIVESGADPNRPEAILDLLPLLDEADRAPWTDILRGAYPLHPATDRAKARGLM